MTATMDRRRGSLTIDDEGTPTQSTTLIEDAFWSASCKTPERGLMGVAPTAMGVASPMRTFPCRHDQHLHAGRRPTTPPKCSPRIKNGLYAVNFGGGQVDSPRGKYVFSCTDAYLVENGKIGAPVKGAMLIRQWPGRPHEGVDGRQ